MKKRLLFLTCILFVSNVMTKAQNDRTVNELHYTIDKQIPSFMEITDKGISIPKGTAIKARHIGLEKLLNLNDETSAILKDTLTDMAGGFHESCIEYYHGIEVEGTRYTIHYNKNGFPTTANGNFRTVKNILTVPKISESDALKSAKSHIGADKYSWEDGEDYPKGKLVVLIKEDKAFLAYKFAINAIVPHSYRFIYINAENGGILDSYSAEYPISSSVQTRYSNTVQIETQYYNNYYRLRDYSRGNGIKTYNRYSQDYLSSNSSWTNMSYFDRSALDVHWGLESTYDFYNTTFGRNSYDNNGGEIISLVNDTTLKNACWEPNYHRMRYGFLENYEGTILLDFPVVSLDITAHELTHGFTQSTSGLSYEKESGALNEGISDVFAVCVEKAITPYKGDYIWCIGEDVSTLRNLSNPLCRYYHGSGWINTSQTPTEDNDYCGVHRNSGVFSYWFYLISKGGTGENQSHLNYPVQSIGFDKAIQICYLMNASYLFPNATYSDAKSCSYLAAQALGYNNNVIDQLRKAWIDVGVESPNLKIMGKSIICGNESYYIDDLPPTCTVTWGFKNASSLNSLIQQNSPSTNQCTITPGSTNLDNTLVATIWNGSISLVNIEKDIMTPKSLTGTIHQEGQYYYGRNYPSFTIGMESIFAVNQVCQITLQSPKFKYMNFSTTTNPLASVNLQRINDETIQFSVSLSTTDVDLRIYGTGNGSCNDFELRVLAMKNPIDPNNPLYVNTSGNVIELELNQAMMRNLNGSENDEGCSRQQPWTLDVYEATTGRKVYSGQVEGNGLNIDTSGWGAGIYILYAVINGKTYSTKVTVK